MDSRDIHLNAAKHMVDLITTNPGLNPNVVADALESHYTSYLESLVASKMAHQADRQRMTEALERIEGEKDSALAMLVRLVDDLKDSQKRHECQGFGCVECTPASLGATEKYLEGIGVSA